MSHHEVTHTETAAATVLGQAVGYEGTELTLLWTAADKLSLTLVGFPLEAGREYDLNVWNVKDLAGNRGEDFDILLQVEQSAAVDTFAPSIVSTLPAHLELSVSLYSAVIITFDDAHLTNYTVAFPALQKYGMTACFFIPTAFVGRGPGEVGMANLEEMARHGNEIQSHSHSHPFLSSLTREEVLDELGQSRDILEQGLGHRVDRIACPGGRYNSTVLDAAREAGYRGVCTSRPADRNIRLGTTPCLSEPMRFQRLA